MATLKKPSKSMAFQNETSNDVDKAVKALSMGAWIVEERNGYAIQYPQGGYFKITKTVYKKLQSIEP